MNKKRKKKKRSGFDVRRRYREDEMLEYYKLTYNVTVDIKEASTMSAVTCEVTVRRTTVFYMLNYMQGVAVHSLHSCEAPRNTRRPRLTPPTSVPYCT